MAAKLLKNIKTVVFMAAITVVFIASLSYAHLKTRDRISMNAENFKKASILYAAGISYEKTAIQSIFAANIAEKHTMDGKKIYYEVLDAAKALKSYVFVTEGPGLWGGIIMAIGIEKDMKTLTGIAFIAQNETPGLGARIEEEWFKKQFKGKIPPLVRVNEGEPTTNNQFDAITGATATSKAVQDIINSFVTQEVPKYVSEGDHQ